MEKFRWYAEHRGCGAYGRPLLVHLVIHHWAIVWGCLLSHSSRVHSIWTHSLWGRWGGWTWRLAHKGLINSHERHSRLGRKWSFVGVYVGFVVNLLPYIHLGNFSSKDLGLDVFVGFPPALILLSSELRCFVYGADFGCLLGCASQMSSEADVIKIDHLCFNELSFEGSKEHVSTLYNFSTSIQVFWIEIRIILLLSPKSHFLRVAGAERDEWIRLWAVWFRPEHSEQGLSQIWPLVNPVFMDSKLLLLCGEFE